MAGYPGLSDAGGNTDVVTRKVWAVFLSLIDDLRKKDTTVDEGLMLTDGADPLPAVVADVPLVRQEAARREIAGTATGSPPALSTTTRGERDTTASPGVLAERRRGRQKRAAASRDASDPAASARRRKRTRRRRSPTSCGGAGRAGSSVVPSASDALQPADEATLARGSPPAEGANGSGAGSDSSMSDAADGAHGNADNLQDRLAELRS